MENQRNLKYEADFIKAATQIKDVQCEAQVLGAMVQNVFSHNEAREIITEECFTEPDYQNIYSALEAIDLRGEVIDLVSLNRELQAQGHTNLIETVINLTISAGRGTIQRDAMYLRELSTRRKLWVNLYQSLARCGELSEDIGEVISGIADDANSLLKGFSNQSCVTLSDADVSLLKQIERNMNENGELTGTPTGFNELDSRGGLQSGSLMIIAAETSMGKTSLALAMAKNSIERGAKVAFYSMEMTMNEISARILATQSGISSSSFLYGKLSDSELRTAMAHTCQDYKKNFFLDDNSTSSLDKIIASIRALKIKYNIDGAFVDYLQMLNVNMKSTNKEQAMGDAARRLKNLAKELNIWIVALSQLNRDKERPVPTLNRLRDSGQIAEAADTVLLIYRPEYYDRSYPEPFEDKDTHGTAMIDVAKGRNIGTFKFLVKFEAPTTNFHDIGLDNIPSMTIDEPF